MRQWLYTDSSAMVKRYRVEEGHEEFEQAAGGAVLVASPLVATEVSRALVVGADDEVAGEVAREDWEADWLAHDVIPLTPGIALHAGSLAASHGLRSLDAIHLASALALQVPMRFATWDRKLWDAARAVGLRTVPAQRP